MAQGSYILRNVSGQSTEECIPNYLGIDYSYPSDVDYLKCAGSFQNSITIKRLSLKRRPRVAVNNVEKTQSGISPSQWHSAESLSSSSSDDTRMLGMSATTRGRPPLPPPHGSSLDYRPSRNEGQVSSQILTESKPQPAARSLHLQRQSPVLEKTIMETDNALDQELPGRSPPQPYPRRRLASFGGVSSPGSLSPFTGLGAYNHNNNGNKPTGTGSDMQIHLSSSMSGRGSTGCLRLSPQSSGRSTPVTSLVGQTHLQLVRDQMVVALQRLKELEEQVKIIPILQVKISVLQEEKRHLVSQLKTDNDEDISEDIWKRAHSVERSDTDNKLITEERLDGKAKSVNTDFRESRPLTKEMQALEKNIKGGHLQAGHRIGHRPVQDNAIKSVAVGPDKIDITLSKENKYVHTDQVEMRSIGTEVSEVNLGIYTEQEEEPDSQQLIIGSLQERICHLEAELEESALQTEMSRLKLELLAAGARNRVDKASLARPSTVSTGTEARPDTTSQGVGNHTEVQDASTGEATEVKTVGVSCRGPAIKNVCIGPDVPMSNWEVRERVETMEKGVGIQVFTNTQGVGMEIRFCDAETNTEVPVENLWSEKRKMKYRSVACGDCSVDVIICEAKEVVSQGIATDKVRGVDLGIMASPQTTSQRTNTVSSSVSRFTNTRHAFNADSSTNTVLSTQDKHTNTTQTLTRTVSVGNRVKDIKRNPEMRTIGVGTTNLPEGACKQTPGTVTKVTRDTGVGLANINDNFLVGLKTRNMASGPSHLPDPIKTRSVGVGEGRIREFSVSSCKLDQMSSQSKWEPELNHYIEKMQWLLREHGDLLTEDYTPRTEGLVQQHCSQGSASSKLPCVNKTAAQGGPGVHTLHAQPSVDRGRESQLTAESSECDRANKEMCHQDGHDVKRMIQMLEQQASSALQDRSTTAGAPRPVRKKSNGDQGCSSNRKNMKFMRVTTGLDPVSSYELSASERTNSEEVERRGNRKSKEASQDGTPSKKGKSGSSRGSKGSTRLQIQQRSKLSEKMFFACQALKKHLSDETTLSSTQLYDCLQILQQDWFSVSSNKSASPDTVEDYLSTFRVIAPSVLQHISNMADGNGNTALHYSVSHSNFGIVKKLLDADVCNVNQQNKAGYTPIMLAALAAVESPEDMRVVEQLFTKGDVNAKASQAGQTALMLAVSHGRMDMVQALLAQGAEVNLQDDEGSTALMCASEHGHAEIVRLLLAQPDCDAALTDSDESTALSIALEAGHHDIAVLLYAHANFSKGQTGAAARHRSLSSSSGRNNSE
ncbi:KN motif and ankyrin repeat domain-containing protein 1-like [Labrus mixtus]|uniref:KN motif and ankyrin repeat domain-containing protein 1-like n=1 Tax=Labrus mixtus TaxID=508554 RepID=UPI0029C0A444|nr:KN motif and ankyrin repeat domain-containing protein 1-like [Labrus mixtus]XP_060917606.1 KN motif and ankyrin repeat domain-containing protein 1-like [Labrus mixtus]